MLFTLAGVEGLRSSLDAMLASFFDVGIYGSPPFVKLGNTIFTLRVKR
jgi:hypothetical protein